MSENPSGCPYCASPLDEEVRPYAYRGWRLGSFVMLVCSVCRRVFHPSQTSEAIEQVARSKGLFAPTPIEGGNADSVGPHDIEVRVEAVESTIPPNKSPEGETKGLGITNEALVRVSLPRSRAATAAN